jgi:hypothetical protein
LPIKVKLASGNAVVGNGTTLGVEDVGSRTFSGTVMRFSSSGIQWGTNTSLANTLGVTTDPTQSGIETSSSGLKLYFYVGETIQDANVINASGVLTRVADLSDGYISGLGMPSDKCIDLTLGASGTEYTAPANGWFNIRYDSTNSGYCSLDNISANLQNVSQGAINCLYTPCKKGDVVKVSYTVNVFYLFKFIYAEG